MFRRIRSIVSRPFAVFALLFCLYAGALPLLGPATASDERSYSGWADSILGRNQLPVPHDYIGFVLIVAAVKSVVSSHWQVVIVLLNAVAAAATGALVVSLVRVTTQRLWTAWLALALFVASYDILLWARYSIPDGMFLGLSFATFAACAFASMSNRKAPPLWIGALLLIVASIVFRQSGVVVVPIAVAAVFVALFGRRRQRAPLRIAYLVMVSGVAGICLIADFFLLHPESAPFARDTVVRLMPYFAKGVVVDGRPETDMPAPRTLADAASLNSARLVRFFQFETAGFSRSHNVANGAYFVPLYLLSLGAAILFFAGGGLPQPVRQLAFLSLVAVSVFAFSRALTFVDFDWRYRLPAIPHLVILASLGADGILERLRQRGGGAGSLEGSSEV